MPLKKQAVEENPPTITIKVTKIQSLIDSHLIYDGQSTGKHYEWLRAGAIVEVDEQDVPELLSKRLGGNTCCGNRDGNLIFKVVGD